MGLRYTSARIGISEGACGLSASAISGSSHLALPAYALVVSFGLIRIAQERRPIEIAPRTHCMARTQALRAVEAGEIRIQAVPLEIGDVLIRHPWALHRDAQFDRRAPRACHDPLRSPLVCGRQPRRARPSTSRRGNPDRRATRHDALSAVRPASIPGMHRTVPQVVLCCGTKRSQRISK